MTTINELPNQADLNETVKNTNRDEGTTGTNRDAVQTAAGYADEDQPVQRPPEGIPEPRPTEPTMGQSTTARG